LSQTVNIIRPFYVTQYLEELDFLHEACLTALFSNRLVKFASVLDNNGKLIIAEYRKGFQNYWRTDLVSDNDYDRHCSSYNLYLDYLVPAIRKIKSCSLHSTKEQQQQEEEVHFEIIEINDNVRLAIASLNERKDKYLSVYIESSASGQEIISKLRNAIV
jgi:hypothetical protein